MSRGTRPPGSAAGDPGALDAPQPGQGSRRDRWLSLLGSLSGIALGLVFIAAAGIKATDPGLFATQITSYGFTPASLGPALAYLLILVELVLGVAVVVQVAPRLGTTALLALLGVFIVATAIAWSQGNVRECGCFGRAAARGPLGVILEDILFVALGVLALRFRKATAAPRPRWILFLLLLPLTLAAPWVGPRLPVDRWVTPIAPGADLSNMAVDGLKVPLQEGLVFLALLGTDCAPCIAALPTLDEIAQAEKGRVEVVGVLAGDQRAARAFRMDHVPSFALGYSPESILRQYYRKVPVFVLLDAGRVTKAWWQKPPSREEIARYLPATAERST